MTILMPSFVDRAGNLYFTGMRSPDAEDPPAEKNGRALSISSPPS